MNALFLDWGKVFKLNIITVYTLGIVTALMSVGGSWWLYGKSTYIRQHAIEQETQHNQQQQRLLLNQLLKVDSSNYESDYQAIASSFPKAFSKQDFFDFLTTNLNEKDLKFKQWQWSEEGNKYVLLIEVEGAFGDITSLLSRVSNYTNLMALTRLNLIRESLDQSLVLGQFEFEFYVQPQSEGQG